MADFSRIGAVFPSFSPAALAGGHILGSMLSRKTDTTFILWVARGRSSRRTNIGFRYYGELQSVQRIESFKVVENVASCKSELGQDTLQSFRLSLRPPCDQPGPSKPVAYLEPAASRAPSTPCFQAKYPSIRAAYDATQRRLKKSL
jgi:hypothetical protein